MAELDLLWAGVVFMALMPGSLVIPVLLAVAWWKGGMKGLRNLCEEQRLRVLGLAGLRSSGHQRPE